MSLGWTEPSYQPAGCAPERDGRDTPFFFKGVFLVCAGKAAAERHPHRESEERWGEKETSKKKKEQRHVGPATTTTAPRPRQGATTTSAAAADHGIIVVFVLFVVVLVSAAAAPGAHTVAEQYARHPHRPIFAAPAGPQQRLAAACRDPFWK